MRHELDALKDEVLGNHQPGRLQRIEESIGAMKLAVERLSVKVAAVSFLGGAAATVLVGIAVHKVFA
jgi:hypothetical protein